MDFFDSFNNKEGHKRSSDDEEAYRKKLEATQKVIDDLDQMLHRSSPALAPRSSAIEQLPAQSSYFQLEDVKTIKVNEELWIIPYDAEFYFKCREADALLFSQLASTDRIRKYLPGLQFSTVEESSATLVQSLKKTEAGISISYVLRVKNIPIGMIVAESPLYNQRALNLRIWTVDFFIAEAFEHKKIMYTCLLRVLNQLKEMGVSQVYCLIAQSNQSCLHLIQGFFTEVDNKGFGNSQTEADPPRVFVLNLTTTAFKTR